MEEKKNSSTNPFMLSKEMMDREKIVVPEILKPISIPKLSTFEESNSRCVSVDTILIAPGGRNKKKESFKGKTALVKFRCSRYQKKLLLIKAKHSGLSLSEFCRRASFEKNIKERLSEEHIEIFKMLTKYHNNFKSIGNMFRKKDPRLSKSVYQLADEIKLQLKKLMR